MCIKELKYCNICIYSERGRIYLFIEIFENFFRFIINEIVDYLFKIFRNDFVLDVKIILFVGGFFEYELV